MVKQRPESVVEIWNEIYLNFPDKRCEEDKNVKIMQIERGSSTGSYIVEFIRLRRKEN